jgi:hypothetical protein
MAFITGLSMSSLFGRPHATQKADYSRNEALGKEKLWFLVKALSTFAAQWKCPLPCSGPPFSYPQALFDAE